MLRFLRSLLGGSPPAPAVAQATHEELDALLEESTLSPDHSHQLCRALRQLSISGQLDLSRVRGRLEKWYAQHPIEVRWRSEYGFDVEEPFSVGLDSVTTAGDPPTLLPWAALLRSLDFYDSGIAFHHGISIDDLLAVLHDPHAPTFEAFRSPALVETSETAWDALLEYVVDHSKMERVRHVELTGNDLTPRHVQRLLGSRRAGQLRSLDLCELLLDREEDEVIATLGAMSRLHELEHLSLCVHTAAQLRALAAHRFPKLTHLSIGDAEIDDAFVDLLRTTQAFPSLRALYVIPTPSLASWMHERGIASSVVA